MIKQEKYEELLNLRVDLLDTLSNVNGLLTHFYIRKHKQEHEVTQSMYRAVKTALKDVETLIDRYEQQETVKKL